MRKIIIFILCGLVCAAMLCACADNTSVDPSVSGDASGDNFDSVPEDMLKPVDEELLGDAMTMTINNPWKDYSTAEEAFSAVGFEMTLPEIEGYVIESYRTMSGYLLEIIYSSGQDTITIRKAIGAEDISGDYTAYTEEMEAEVADNKCVTFKGQNGSVKLCVWTCGDYSYSVSFEAPVLQEYAQNIVLAVE